ncbi:MAG: tetratricopeptide repeat protein [Planctomycetota bacterium]
MKDVRMLLVGWLSVAALCAQAGEVEPKVDEPSKKVATAPKLSDAARAAIGEARALAKASRGKNGPERARSLELAASAFDRCVARFEAEPRAAALAAWSAAELWRRHGSLLLAEKDYLHAASCDAPRYGQRGLLGAADMQRRQQRLEEAMKSYAAAEKVDPATSRAQRARLWMARMLQSQDKIDAAIARFQAALESAPSPRQAIDAADFLAKAWIVKGDLESAGFVIEHAEKLVREHEDGDPIVAERLRRACQRMSARKALQRALDDKHDAAGDAVRLDEHRRKNGK